MISLLGLQLDSELSRSFRGASGETFLRMGKKQPSKFMAATSLNHDGLNQNDVGPSAHLIASQ